MAQQGDKLAQLIKKKADAYYLLKEKIHVSYLSGHWTRGIVKDIKPDYFIIEDDYYGEVIVYYEELKDIQKYKLKESGKNGSIL
jgi:hypothetical protein